jgi:hypothetical protein
MSPSVELQMTLRVGQVLIVTTLFERTPLDQLLTRIAPDENQATNTNQLFLFD